MRRAQLIGLVGIVVASGLWATPAAGQELRQDGNELIRACGHVIDYRQNDALESGLALYCTGLVRGVWQMLRMAATASGGKLCTPDEATNGQMVRVVVKYLEENPEDLHRSDVFLVATAIGQAFPCSP